MTPPRIGDLYISPRGRHYVVIARHPTDALRVTVEDVRSKQQDSFFWPNGIPEHGWERLPSPLAGDPTKEEAKT